MVQEEQSAKQPQLQKRRYKDIWSRPGMWARQRAYIFLCINIAVFSALNMFLYYLHAAKYLDFSWQSYTQTRHVTLLRFLVFPISVYEVPVMIVVLGMLMAITVMVPILAAQLYGFLYALIFAAVVVVFGHMPVLGLFLAFSAFVASAPVTRLPFKFGSALLALVPIVVYFYVATRGDTTWQAQLLDPTPLYAPWVLALLGCGLIAAIVLSFARLVKYRPGGVLLSMIPFFVIPVLLFYKYVGPDELVFRLLEYRCGPDSEEVFKPTDVSETIFQRTKRAWRKDPVRNLDVVLQLARKEFPFVADSVLQEQQQQVITACQKFQHRFPDSEYLANVLYIKGLAIDTKVNQQALWTQWQVHYYNSFVNPLSRDVWQQLLQVGPNSAHGAEAMYRLAILDVRGGQIDRARQMLEQLINQWGRPMTETRPAAEPLPFWRFFSRPMYVVRPAIDPRSVARQGKALLELIENNRDDPQYGNKPLQQLMNLDHQDPAYDGDLATLAAKHPGGKLHDNLLVLSALNRGKIDERVMQLKEYATAFEGNDAGALACFELARLYQALGLARRQSRLSDQAVELYRQVIDQYPNSLLADQAAENLEQLKVQ